MALVCNKCKNSINDKEYLICTKCNLVFDIGCAGRSLRLFQLMPTEKKKAWKCLTCRKNITPEDSINKKKALSTKNTDTATIKNKNGNTSTVKSINSSPLIRDSPDMSNISPLPSTSLIKSKSEDCLLQVDNEVNTTFQSIDDESSKSLELTTDLDIVNDLKLQINNLKLKLQSTECELENIILEKNDAKRQIDKLTREICTLKNIVYKSPLQLNKSRNSHGNILSPEQSVSTPKIAKLEEKILELQIELSKAQDEIVSLNETIENLKQKLRSRNKTESKIDQRTFVNEVQESINISSNVLKSTNKLNINKQNKLCFISSSKRFRIVYNIAKIEFYNDYQLCHYLITNAGAEILMCNIENKIKDYTKDDYCVIMIGETDFRTSKDYRKIVDYIKNVLTKITHTNIIIITPSYICGSPIYNYRVETFNNLLYDDVHKHHYALLCDSNGKVTLEMFSAISGKIINSGIQCILRNVADLIQQIDQYSRNPNIEPHMEPNLGEECNILQKNKFFLLQ